jgi:short-subunit dehydrogenase
MPGVATSPGHGGATTSKALVIGASDGIGAATARRLAADGWGVTTLSRRAADIVCDVTDPAYRATLASVIAERGPFRVCVYCPGIGDRLSWSDLAAEARVFEVNLMGAVATAEVMLPAMLAANEGHLVVLSSLADELISPESPSYNASKAAMTSYFEGLARALRRRGSPIAVTNVRFGFVDTKMAKSETKPFLIRADDAAEVIVRALRKRPVRVTHPLRMAILVRLLRWLS